MALFLPFLLTELTATSCLYCTFVYLDQGKCFSQETTLSFVVLAGILLLGHYFSFNLFNPKSMFFVLGN